MSKYTPNTVLVAFFALATAVVGCMNNEKAPQPPETASQECTSLFDGETLNGWAQLGNAAIFVEDGAIVGTGVQEPVNTFLRTNQEYTDFDLSLEFKIDSLFNSGIQFRSAVAVEEMIYDHQAGNGDRYQHVTEPGRVYGIQAEIDGTQRGWTAQVYEEQGRGWLETFSKETMPLILDHSAWNRIRVRVIGDSISTWINGNLIAAMTDTEGRSSGFIALQIHSVRRSQGSNLSVRFRDIDICTL